MKPQQIDHVAITVAELERSIAWYGDVLGLERRFQDEWGDVPTMMCAGETCVALFVSERPGEGPVGPHQTPSLHHVAFRVDRQNFEAARQRFSDLGIEFRTGRPWDRAVGLRRRPGWPPDRDHDLRR